MLDFDKFQTELSPLKWSLLLPLINFVVVPCRAEQLAQVQHKVEEMTPRKGDANYGSLKRSTSRGGTLKKYKFVSSDHLDEESFSKSDVIHEKV